MRHFVADRAIELALLPQDRDRQQIDRRAVGGARHPPRLAGGAAEAFDRRMHGDAQARGRRGAGRFRDLVAAAANQRQQRLPLALFGAGQRQRDIARPPAPATLRGGGAGAAVVVVVGGCRRCRP